MSPMDVTRPPSTAARPCAKSSLSTHKTVPHALTRASTVLNSLFVRLRGWSGSDLGNGDLPHSWPPWEVSVDGSCGEPTTDYKRAFYLSLSSDPEARDIVRLHVQSVCSLTYTFVSSLGSALARGWITRGTFTIECAPGKRRFRRMTKSSHGENKGLQPKFGHGQSFDAQVNNQQSYSLLVVLMVIGQIVQNHWNCLTPSRMQ